MRKRHLIFGWAPLLGALTFCALGLSTYAAPDYWFSDNMSFFLRQLGFGALCGVIWGCVLIFSGWMKGRLFKGLTLGLAGGLMLLALMTTLRTMALSEDPNSAAAPDLKLISINLERLYLNNKTLTDYLEAENADILLFQETFWWQQDRLLAIDGLTEIAGLGPYPEHLVRGELGQTSIFSKFPITNVEYIEVPATDIRNLTGYREIVILDIETPQGPIQLFAVHPNSPRSPTRWQERQNYLALLTEAVQRRQQASNSPVIIMGDWNTSPWSGHFFTLLDKTGLNTAFPNGIPQTTRFFYDYRLHWILGAIVDHVAISDDFQFADVSLGPDVGTDHLPLEVELQRIVE